MNYSKSNNSRPPFKRGKLLAVVKLKRPLVTRVRKPSESEKVTALASDLVRVLAGLGIVIKGSHKIARALAREGWVKIKKIKRDIT